MKVPHTLLTRPGAEQRMAQGLQNVVGRTRISLPERSLADLIRDTVWEQLDSHAAPDTREGVSEAVEVWVNQRDIPVSVATLQDAAAFAQPPTSAVRDRIANLVPAGGTKRGTANSAIDRTIRVLNRLAGRMQNIPPSAMLSIPALVQLLNENVNGRIVVVTARRDDDLKLFGKVLGEELYESRRQAGRQTPFTSFIFDEADLFLPNDDNDEVTLAIRETCVTIARRGRKFGIGIGLATQRVTHLDTHVMGNLHTYFVSKLPRKTDRERVAEAFGIGDEQLAPTFSFRPGNWLVLSHDATGLKGVPIPTTADDANARIVRGASQGAQ